MEDIQNLIDMSSGTDLSTILSAKETAKRRMLEDPSSANISSYDRASAMLDRALEKERISAAQAVPVSAPVVESVKFRRLSEVVKFLKDEGYKVKKSKVYMDAKAGYLVAAEDGGYSQEAVLAYVHTQSLEKIADSKAGKLDALSELRLEKEVEKLTVQVEKLTWDMERDQGKYLPKEDVRTELALKISAFEAGFKHIAVTRASDWVAAVGGRQEKQQVMIDMIHSAIDTLLGEFAQVDELDLVVVANG
ncbi:MAG: hypothetical protein V1844_09840 [Pseudomonadota bacterium]